MKAQSKWIVIGGIVLMLLAMFAYVMSDDEAYTPSVPVAEEGAE